MTTSNPSLNDTIAAVSPLSAGGEVTTSRQVLTTAPLTGGGDLSADRTIAIPKATASVDGFIAAADFAKILFNLGQQTTVGSAGVGSALPATPTGYIQFKIGATTFVIPYYAAA